MFLGTPFTLHLPSNACRLLKTVPFFEIFLSKVLEDGNSFNLDVCGLV